MTDIIFCHFGPFFALLMTQKIKIWKKGEKKKKRKRKKNTPGDITILHKGNKNHDHMLHCSAAVIFIF